MGKNVLIVERKTEGKPLTKGKSRDCSRKYETRGYNLAVQRQELRGGKIIQLQLPGMEKCNWQCLTNCPMEPLGKECLWDDPLIGMFDQIPYSEFEIWRWDHEDLVRPEPKDPMQTRCPRCFSTQYITGYPYVECKNCGYNEPLIDFPISRYFHLALEQMFNDKS